MVMLERFNRISDAKIVCPNCSHENPAPYRFCGMCGNALPRLTAGVPGEASAPASRTAESPVPRIVPPPPEPEPARGQPISGPSFLGLNEPTDRSADYLLDEEEEPSGHWRIDAALAIVAVFAILLGLQWKNGKLNRAKVMDLVQRVQTALNSKKPASTTPWPDQTATEPASTEESAAAVNDQHASPAPKVATPPESALPAASKPPETPNQQAPSESDSTPAASAGAAHNATTPGAPKSDESKAPSQESASVDQADNSGASTDHGSSNKAPAEKTPTAATPRSRNAAARETTPNTKNEDPGASLVARADALLYNSAATQDCDRAVGLLREAAGNDSASAKSRLGTLYATGHCVPLDRPSAYRWFALALRQSPNNMSGEHNMQMLWGQMTPDEKQLAVKMSQ